MIAYLQKMEFYLKTLREPQSSQTFQEVSLQLNSFVDPSRLKIPFFSSFVEHYGMYNNDRVCKAVNCA